MQKKIAKKIFVSEIIASKLGALHCPYEEENICYWQSMF